MLCGLLTTFLIPETKRKTLEELAGEVPGTDNYDPVMAGHSLKGDNSSNEETKVLEPAAGTEKMV